MSSTPSSPPLKCPPMYARPWCATFWPGGPRRRQHRLAAYAAGIGRPRDYPVLLEGLVQRVAEEADRQVADVRSAVEMTEAQRSRLAAALTRFAGYQVDVRVSTEPGLLGGFVASVGDTVFDASLRRRLEQARSLLFAPSTSARRSGRARPGPKLKGPMTAWLS